MMPGNKLLPFVVFALTGFLQIDCSTRRDKDSTLGEKENEFPPMTVTMSDGAQLNIRELTGKVVLVLFQTDCDHCQREATAIQQNILAFKKYSLYFVSTTSQAEINAFASEYNLAGYDNVHFCRTTSQSILDNFGPIDAPSLYIYVDQKLVKAFNGETEIGRILTFI